MIDGGIDSSSRAVTTSTSTGPSVASARVAPAASRPKPGQRIDREAQSSFVGAEGFQLGVQRMRDHRAVGGVQDGQVARALAGHEQAVPARVEGDVGGLFAAGGPGSGGLARRQVDDAHVVGAHARDEQAVVPGVQRCAGQAADLQLHQPFGRKADHLAQQVRIRGLLHKVAEVHHVGGHRWSSRFWVGVSNQTLTEHRR